VNEQDLTPWFPGSVEPVREGVYQRQFGSTDNLGYCFWDGTHWHFRALTPIGAMNTSLVSTFHRLPWRGLAKEPK
jgi:hypothetical protein